MPAKSEIDKIIGGLELGESRYIRARLRGKKRELFDFYRQEKKFEERDLAILFPSLDTKGLITLRAHLEDRITLLLGEYHTKNTPQERIRVLRLKGMAYIAKSQTRSALRELNQAYDLALQFEEFNEALEIAQYLESLQPFGYQKATRGFNEVSWSTSLMLKALDLKQIIGAPKLESAKQLIQTGRQDIPIKAQCYFLRSQAVCYLILRDTANCLNMIEQAKALLKSNTCLLHDPLLRNTAIALYLTHSNILVANGELGKGEQCIIALEELLNKISLAAPKILSVFLLEIKFELAWLHRDIPNLLLQAQRIGNELNSEMEGHPKQQQQIKILVAQRLLEAKQYDLSYDWISKLLKPRPVGASNLLLATAAILELVCLFMKGEFENLYESCRRASYLFKSRGLSGSYTDCVLKSFRSIAKSPDNSVQAFYTLSNQLEALRTDPISQSLSEGFNLLRWVRENVIFQGS